MNHDGKVIISTALNNKGLEKGLKSVSGTLGGLGKVVGGLALSITAAFGAAAVAITKQATDAYADYEQLTGGMATMFGKSASKIAKYAEDAFYYAGVSANEYMEIVTDFSASLISSLAGDTEAAADVANMALNDMSDNANKMGSTLESIQEAYKGFSKQQYQLLDNLKLGYGGTKAEMERLLRDAEAYSGVKYDINNLADVYKAIHAIQEKMGIAGATAAEAEGTITGSANMTKAAWKNVLSAISGGGDLDKAINNLVYSVSKYFDNIVPVVERSLSGIGQLIEKIAPRLVQTVAASLIRAIPSLLNAVYQMVIGLAKGIYQGIVALFSGKSFSGEIKASLNNVAAGFSSAASGAEDLEQSTEAAGKAAKKSLSGFDELNTLADQSSGGGSSDIEIPSFTMGGVDSPESAGDISGAISPIFKNILDNIKKFLAPLWTALEPIVLWLKDTVIVVLNDLKELGKGIAEKWKENSPKIQRTIENIGTVIEKLWVVVEPILTWIRDALSTLVKETTLNELQALFDRLHAISEILAGLVSGDFSQVLNGFGLAVEAESKYAESMIKTFAKTLGIDLDAADRTVKEASKSIAKWLSDARRDIEQAWEDVAAWFNDTVIVPLQQFWEPIGGWFEQLFESIERTIADVFFNIGVLASGCWEAIKIVWGSVSKWFDETVIQPVTRCFSELWTGFSTKASEAWEGVKTVFGRVASFFRDTFEKAWAGIIDVFSVGGEIFTDIKDGVLKAFKTIVNGLIRGINNVIAAPFNGINAALEKISGFEIGGQKIFSNIKKITVPKVPYLAQGAVLPPNKPFMAVVGDQRHGTNVEAPLATIQEAVMLAMADQVPAMMAGFEAVVARQEKILAAIEASEVGDTTIGEAAQRYNLKMAIVNGV